MKLIELTDVALELFTGTEEYHYNPAIGRNSNYPILCTDGVSYVSKEFQANGNIMMLERAIMEHGATNKFLVCKYGFDPDATILETGVFRIEDGNNNLLAKVDMEVFDKDLSAVKSQMWAVKTKDGNGREIFVIMLPSEY